MDTNEGSLSVIHKSPSVICCAANIKGILAKSICGIDLTFLIEAIPMAERTIPAPKLAPAEKHITYELLR